MNRCLSKAILDSRMMARALATGIPKACYTTETQPARWPACCACKAKVVGEAAFQAGERQCGGQCVGPGWFAGARAPPPMSTPGPCKPIPARRRPALKALIEGCGVGACCGGMQEPLTRCVRKGVWRGCKRRGCPRLNAACWNRGAGAYPGFNQT